MKTNAAILATTSAICAALLAVYPTSTKAGPLDDVARIDVIPGWQTAQGTHMAGIRITLAPGWKTYWRSPGDAGIPPHFTWSGSSNIAAAQFHWPVPEVMDQNGMQTIGYHDGVVVPVELSPTQPGMPITMAGDVQIGVCEDICVPVSLSFAAEIPPDGKRDAAITASLINQPLAGADAGLQAATCAIAPNDSGLEVTATLTMPATGLAETVIIEAGHPDVWVSPSDVTRQGNKLRATVDMVHMTGGSFALDRSGIRITVLGSDYAVDVQGCKGN